MPLIARKDNDPIRSIYVKLPQSVIDRLDKYAAYVQGDRSYVVTEALKLVFAQDKEFVKADGMTDGRRSRPGRAEPQVSPTNGRRPRHRGDESDSSDSDTRGPSGQPQVEADE